MSDICIIVCSRVPGQDFFLDRRNGLTQSLENALRFHPQQHHAGNDLVRSMRKIYKEWTISFRHLESYIKEKHQYAGTEKKLL